MSLSRVAAIDCGTNSIRLLVADLDPDTGELHELDRRMTIVRLGQGVDRTGRLAPEALERTFAACREYASVIAAHGATRLRFVATSASRDAENREEFTAGVRAILGVEPEVVSGDEEAELSFTGATRELLGSTELRPPYLVFDLGVNILAPGIHCGNLTVQQNATAMLLPGTYYFVNSVLLLKDSSTLQGSNVTLIFDSNSYIQFQDNSVVDLTAATTGQYAGFVMATTEQNTNTFSISSNSAHRMLGTLYMPAATLAVSGTGNTVADQSAWTVVIAKGITMSGSANLVINSSYGSSNVPVPQGVGNNAGVVLVK